MGFTIQDMLITSESQYQMKLLAGHNGWSNSISWVLMIEDTKILNNFSGKELAVTTGLGFRTEKELINLAKGLVNRNASGLIINTGEYMHEIPQELISFCNENDLPLIDIPWEIYLADMIKDLSIRIFLQGTADEQISEAFIEAITYPEHEDKYRKTLLSYFDIDGDFQVILFTTDNLDSMDTVDRKKLSYKLQIYLENISHNGHFFYYDSCFVLVLNDIEQDYMEKIVNGMLTRTKARMPEVNVYGGTGSPMKDICNLYLSYNRARAALEYAKKNNLPMIYFDNMGADRLFSSVADARLLQEMGEDVLSVLIEYDKKHEANYVETLGLYLKHNGSVQAVADELFTHRNTVVYRVSNIKKMLETDFDDAEERFKYLLATRIVEYSQKAK